MIEFIQDYITKSLPPESFADGQQVERSPESELYLVRLGVAGFLIDGVVVDQDHQPIVRQTVLVVSTDRRFADTGRAGEVIGLDAPQRASSGPGNAVLFAGQPGNVGLTDVEIEQLRGDLGAVRLQFDEHRAESGTEIERLKGLIETGNEAFREMNNSHVENKDRISGERDDALSQLDEVRKQHDDLVGEYKAVCEKLDAATPRIAELERQLAEATAAKPIRGK